MINPKSINDREKLNILKVKLKYFFRRTSLRGKDAQSAGDQILDNHIYISKDFPVHHIHNIDDMWKLSAQNLNTYKSYLYGLQPIGYLNNAFEYTKNKKYLLKGIEIMISWLNTGELNKYDSLVWYEFSVSNRVITLIELLQHCLQAGLTLPQHAKIKVIDSLINYANFLSNDSNYVNNNHGVIQDRALLEISCLFAGHDFSQNWQNKALQRLSKQFRKAFNEESINVENSPFYHKYNIDLFSQSSHFLEYNGIIAKNLLREEFRIKIKKAINAHQEMLKPDQSLPLIGDTEVQKFPAKYKNKSIVYPNTGLVFFKNDRCYISLKSGYTNLSHKHFDDLSFTVFYDNKDILIDCGKYNYVPNDKFRNYLKSVLAHNTISLNQSNYPLNNPAKTGIHEYKLQTEFEYVIMYNYLYNKIKLVRYFIYIKPNLIIIIDKANNSAKQINLFNQSFNINGDFSVADLSEYRTLFTAKNSNHQVTIIQNIPVRNYQFFYNDKKNVRGLASEKFGELKPANHLSFINETGKHGEMVFLTSILFTSNNNDEIIDHTITKIDNNTLKISCKYNHKSDSVYTWNALSNNKIVKSR
ncbi:heparinase II/III family protein [Cytobacillus firmus]|uniref:Uncharacterized protein n=1 Tax=Cytobacillus firmus DS1 TaxID=1307436 RepID=W7L500_CYTFI|nr:heparinase II/III family protein [Cytobacillus firmus]EWG10242.1 hypothetical protein PBF_14104 [Cytobacillus firmus DS1]